MIKRNNKVDIIQLVGISKQYGGKVVFQGVNLRVQSGTLVVLRGESGAGKSTLLNIIGGLERPSAGQIMVDGRSVLELTARERADFYRHEIGIIFQGSYLQPQFSLFENITLPGVFAGMPAPERKMRAERLAQMLGISDNLSFLPSQVSGGQAERACIARALLLSPKIILADEPTSNLDEANAKIVLEILNYVRVQMGVTIIIASHSRDVLQFATQVINVANGAVVEVQNLGVQAANVQSVNPGVAISGLSPVTHQNNNIQKMNQEAATGGQNVALGQYAATNQSNQVQNLGEGGEAMYDAQGNF